MTTKQMLENLLDKIDENKNDKTVEKMRICGEKETENLKLL